MTGYAGECSICHFDFDCAARAVFARFLFSLHFQTFPLLFYLFAGSRPREWVLKKRKKFVKKFLENLPVSWNFDWNELFFSCTAEVVLYFGWGRIGGRLGDWALLQLSSPPRGRPVSNCIKYRQSFSADLNSFLALDFFFSLFYLVRDHLELETVRFRSVICVYLLYLYH